MFRNKTHQVNSTVQQVNSLVTRKVYDGVVLGGQIFGPTPDINELLRCQIGQVTNKRSLASLL